jgi:hypothetical protein
MSSSSKASASIRKRDTFAFAASSGPGAMVSGT